MAKGSILITGANGGLGSAFVSQLLKSPYAKDYHGIYTVRNPSTATELQATVKTAPAGHAFEIPALDLSSLAQIRAAAAAINARVSNGTLAPLRALVLNAAFQDASAASRVPQAYTPDGHEAAFAVNYLANFLFVLLVLRSVDTRRGRIVMVSSCTHDAFSPRNMDFFKEDKYKVMYTDTESLAKGIEYADGSGFDAGMRRYGASKLLMVMFMYELQRRIAADPELANISVLSLDPGAMGGTSLAKRGPWWVFVIAQVIMPLLQGIIVYFAPQGFIRSPKKSAGDVLWACFDEETLGEHPKAVFLDGRVKVETSQESQDVKKQKSLWTDSLKLADIKDGDTVLKDWR